MGGVKQNRVPGVDSGKRLCESIMERYISPDSNCVRVRVCEKMRAHRGEAKGPSRLTPQRCFEIGLGKTPSSSIHTSIGYQ